MTITLRGWQAAAQATLMARWQDRSWSPGVPGLAVIAATGAGKTIFALDTVHRLVQPPGRILWLAHRDELLQSPLQTLAKHWPATRKDAGLVKSTSDQVSRRVVFASVQTLADPQRRERLRRAGAFDLIVYDECHHSVSDSYDEVLRDMLTPSVTRVLGLTATLDREDGRDLGEHWQVAHSYPIVEAIRDRVLLQPFAAVARVPEVDVFALPEGGQAQGEALLAAHIVEHTVSAMGAVHLAESLPWRRDRRQLTCRGRHGLVFTATVEQARRTTRALIADGWAAATVWGDMPAADRRRALRSFMRGRLNVLVSPAVLTEGTDLPVASFVVLARATRSWSLAIQCIGRGLRTMEGKADAEALILDLAGATEVHSLVGAPVVIGKDTSCDAHGDGRHRYQPFGDGGGQCECGATVACLKRQGPHVHVDGVCKSCGAVQCPESPDGRHVWTPPDDGELGKMVCAWCGTESPSPLAGMVARRPKASADPIAWRAIPGAHLEGAQLGETGMLFRHPDGRSWWVRPERDEVTQLTRRGTPDLEVEAVADDVARKVAAVAGQRGGAPAPWYERRQVLDLTDVAVRLFTSRVAA